MFVIETKRGKVINIAIVSEGVCCRVGPATLYRSGHWLRCPIIGCKMALPEHGTLRDVVQAQMFCSDCMALITQIIDEAAKSG